MKIIESFLAAKSNDVSLCEDAVYYNDNFAGVIDGATSKGQHLWEGKTSGQKAVELILATIKNFPYDIDSISGIKLISARIEEYYKNKGQLQLVTENPAERITASMVLYSKCRNEVWQIGDCAFMIDDKIYTNNKKVDEILSEVRSLVLEISLLDGISPQQLRDDDIGRNFILPLLERQGILQNHPTSRYSFAVIDGFDVDLNKIVVKQIPKGTKQIILASDGYPDLRPTLTETEECLKKIIAEDPLCMDQYKATKGLKEGNQSFDDRAYLRIGL